MKMLHLSIILLPGKRDTNTMNTANVKHFLSRCNSELLQASSNVRFWHFYATRWGVRVLKSSGVITNSWLQPVT